MKVIAVSNLKGGVGKTITATSISYLLGVEKNKKVLVIDADQQANTTRTFGRFDPEGTGIMQLLEGEDQITNLIQDTPYGNIHILPSNMYLVRTNAHLMFSEDNQIDRLKEALEEIKNDYDYVICDCGLILDMTVLNVMMAADLLIIPVKAGGYGIEGAENLQEQIQEIRPDLNTKILMTMKAGNKINRETEEWMKRNYGNRMFQTAIRRSVVVEKAETAFMPLTEFSKRSNPAKDYKKVIEEIIKK